MKYSTVWTLVPMLLVAVGVRIRTDWSDALIFDRWAIAQGEWWRWITGHLVHYSWSHLVGDALAMILGGALLGRRIQGGNVLGLAASALCIPAAIGWWKPEWRYYAGSSGLAMTLVAMAAAGFMRSPDWRRGFGWVLMGLVGGKIGWESYTATLLIADIDRGPIEPATLAHVVGAGVGALVGWIFPNPDDGWVPQHPDGSERRAVGSGAVGQPQRGKRPQHRRWRPRRYFVFNDARIRRAYSVLRSSAEVAKPSRFLGSIRVFARADSSLRTSGSDAR